MLNVIKTIDVSKEVIKEVGLVGLANDEEEPEPDIACAILASTIRRIIVSKSLPFIVNSQLAA